ncbi:hypothetical protein QQ008_06635 [Fulvivirgaceae bacterium BMA10]|uniref:Uncharacterized protein n=1 Tax=Splendidivirga corallicola TaxID=3051826 RepID=A0ABT8KJZ1_9BACT|nr:hypothetical protein [Fulvivirgaceae bacterium BMA10]
MKTLFIVIFSLLTVAGLAQNDEGKINENFSKYDLPKITYLKSKVTFGNFIYEFRQNDILVDSSSLITVFDENGSLFVGQQKEVTDFRIKSANGDDFEMRGFQFSSNHSFSNPDEQVTIRGWRDGKVVTPPVEVQIGEFHPPGSYYDFTVYQGFEKIDEIKITGKRLEFTLEDFNYGLPMERKPVATEKDKKKN